MFALGMLVKLLSRVRLSATPWTVAYLAPPSLHGILQARVLEWVAKILDLMLSSNTRLVFGVYNIQYIIAKCMNK